MKKKIGWGILGCGHIAGSFAEDLSRTKHGELVAAGSRSKRKADLFAKKYHADRAYGSYEELLADPDVDIVYVATPHPCHMDNALSAISHGKHVLCEKPLAMNAKQSRRMISAAKKKGVFLMEGMWTRFFPATLNVKKWLDEKRIGTVLALEADFGIHFKVGPEHRIFNPELGGGALLDLGIYPVSFASLVFAAPPEKIISTVHFADTGVDDHAVMVFEYSSGATAVLNCSSRVQTKQEARIFGTDGMITVHPGFYHPTQATLEIYGKKPRTVTFPHAGHGFQYEAEHIHQCLRKGSLQSDIMPLDETLTIIETLDKIRRQWKLKYENE